MGWAEKLNPNSEWYKKRHPKIEPIKVPTEVPKKVGFWNRLVRFIKRIFGQLSPKRAT